MFKICIKISDGIKLFSASRLLVLALMLGAVSRVALAQKGVSPSDQPEPCSTILEGILNVEADSGAACLGIPLGPGIGDASLRYDPMLVGRFAPLVGLAALPSSHGGVDSAPALLATSGFALTPGTLDWKLVASGVNNDPAELAAVTWTYPDGTRGGIGGSLPGAIEPRALQERFGYDARMDRGFLPHPIGTASGPPCVMSGTGGAFLLGLCHEAGFPPRTLSGVDGKGNPIRWMVPSGFLVIRGQTAYEFSYSEEREAGAGKDVGNAHYLLASIRNASGEAVTFTYGENGVDYDATWHALKVRVALDGLAPVSPTIALDDALSSLHPEAPIFAFRNTLARLRVTYEGMQNPQSYSVIALARPEFQTPVGTFVGGFHTAVGSGDSATDSFRRNLQVSMVRDDRSGAYFRFAYGKAASILHPGQSGTQSFAPTVLREIGHPGRSLCLTWAAGPTPGSRSAPSPDNPVEDDWQYGVCAIEDRSTGVRRKGTCS